MDIDSIIRAFFKNIEILDYHPYGNGHINDTYIISLGQKKNNISITEQYILQRINHLVFKNPIEMMKNIKTVSNHIRKNLKENGEKDIERKVLTIVPTINGTVLYIDKDKNYWRVYEFIRSAETIDFTRSQKQLYLVAAAFGKFLKQLNNLPINKISITIPNFHNTKFRFEEFMIAMEKDSFNRKAEIKEETDFLFDRQFVFKDLEETIKKSSIPLRVTHNDTKINNVMLDKQTGEGLCVIDFDTIMPGYSIFDFGDLVRSAIRNAPESEKDLSKIFVDLDRFRSITKGFLSEARDILTESELNNLVRGSLVITMMIGMRFLTDYLNGDKYFKTTYKEHNLNRCRVQFKLVKSILENRSEMEDIVQAIVKSN